MPNDFSVVEGEYLRDILDQPQALERTLASLQESKKLAQLKDHLQKGQFKNVVLTGMGSSFHALHPLNLGLIEHGFTSLMVETSELVHYQGRLLDSKNLLVVVSQSGESAETIRLLEINRGLAPIIAITNTENSPLAQTADATILTQAGKEFSVSCKTYLAALMALSWLDDVLCERNLRGAREELQKSISSTASYLAGWKGHVQCLAESLKGIRDLFLVGRGPSLAAAGTGALIVKESAHCHAESMSSAAFRHGPFEMLSEGTFVLVFAGSSRTRHLNQRLVQDIGENHGKAELVADNSTLAPFTLPSVPSRIRPILEILPVQMITLALAAQSGREAGRFERASKVTTTE